jgi:hypothetical protein
LEVLRSLFLPLFFRCYFIVISAGFSNFARFIKCFLHAPRRAAPIYNDLQCLPLTRLTAVVVAVAEIPFVHGTRSGEPWSPPKSRFAKRTQRGPR